jgi:hypothetical protein
MQEFGSKYEAETLRSAKKTELVDVILYIYDSSDTNSFSYISNLRVRDRYLLVMVCLADAPYSSSTVSITFQLCLFLPSQIWI